MAKKTKKKKSEAKVALEEAVTAVQNGQSYNLEAAQPPRGVGEPVYAKIRDLEQLKTDVTEKIEEDNKSFAKDLSRLEQAQTRVTDRLDRRSLLLRNALVITIVLVVILVGLTIWMVISIANLSSQIAQKQTQTTVATSSVVEPSHDINLDEKDTDITLAESGEYNLTGTTTHTINVTASDEDVTLHFNNVNIMSDAKSAINYTGGHHTLYIDLMNNTQNTLSSNGTEVNGGTIHSTGWLAIYGGGSLDVYGAGEYGNGIKTDNVYYVDGGKILSLGSDMIEKPANSQQRFLSFDLNEIIKNGSSVQIRNQSGTILKSFVATQDFRTVIWSQPNLNDGAYSLFVNGKKIQTINL